MPTILRYFISGSNADLLELGTPGSEFSLSGQQVIATGSASVNTVRAAPGVDLDVRNLLGGEDVVIFSHRWDQYTKDISSVSGAMVFSYTESVSGLTERVTVLNGSTTLGRDKLVFADGAVLTQHAKTALTTSLTASLASVTGYTSAAGSTTSTFVLPTPAGNIYRAFASTTNVDGQGAAFAMAPAGQTLIATGSGQVDKVYVKAGAVVDARNLLAGEDVIFFSGRWADYAKSLSAVSGAIQFTRTVNGMNEVVTVLNGSTTLGRDKLVFADGAVLTQNARAALTSNLSVAISAVTGHEAATVTPFTASGSVPDTMPPSVSAVTDATTASVTKDPISFTVTFSEALASDPGTANFTATNGSVTSVTKVDSTRYTVLVTPEAGLASGSVALSLVGGTLKDAAGNAVANASLSSLASQAIDTLAPAAPSISTPSATSTSTSATIAGTAEANSTVTIFDGTSVLGTTSANSSGAFSFNASGLSPSVHSISAKATDAAGNVSAASAAISLTITAGSDSTLTTVADGGVYTATSASNTYVVDASATMAATIQGFASGDVLRIVNGSELQGINVSDSAYGDNATTVVAGNAVIALTGLATDLFAPNQAGFTGQFGSGAVSFADSTPPAYQSLAVSSGNGLAGGATVTLTYDSPLDGTHAPLASAFTVLINGSPNEVAAVVVNGNTVTLTLAGAVAAGSLSVSVAYADPTSENDTQAIQDLAGNDAISNTIVSGVVADGYIRGASVYVDTNSDGLATSADHFVGTTDAQGRFFIPTTAPAGKLVVTGGINNDTGLPNTLTLKAPAPDLGKPVAINPLTTLVASMVSGTVTPAQAADKVAAALGLSLPPGKDLLSTDLIAAAAATDSATAAFGLAAHKAAAQVATIASLASSDSSANATAASKVFENLAQAIKAAPAGAPSVDLTSNVVLSAALAGAVSGTAATTLTSAGSTLRNSVAAISSAVSVGDVGAAQAQFLDTIAPDAPTSLVVAPLTNDTTPEVRVHLNVTSLDGKAAVQGNTVELHEGTTLLASVVLTAADIANGHVLISPNSAKALTGQGAHTLSVKVKDNAGLPNVSAAASVSLTLDTQGPTASVTAATVANTGGLDVQSTEPGTAYLVRSTVSVTNLASITGAADAQWNSVAVATANSATSLSAAGLVDGTYKVYAVDAAGNLSAASANTVTLDSTRPTIAITSDKMALAAGQSATITFNLSEPVSDFVLSDIDCSGATLSDFRGSGSSYAVTLTRAESGSTAVTVGVGNAKFSDAAGNQNADGNDADNVLSLSQSQFVPTTLNLPSGSPLTEAEAISLYLVNQLRQDPQGWADMTGVELNKDSAGQLITNTNGTPFDFSRKDSLVFSGELIAAARGHSQVMLNSDSLFHESGSDTVRSRIETAGYQWASYGENVNWYAGLPTTPEAIARQSVEDLFVDLGIAGAGHRTNLLASGFADIGLGYALGEYLPGVDELYGTQNFGRNSAEVPFLTGFVLANQDGNFQYNNGEGLPGVTISIVDTSDGNKTYSTTTLAHGYWQFQAVAGRSYTVSASGGGFVGTALAQNVSIATGGNNGFNSRTVDFFSGSPLGRIDYAVDSNIEPTGSIVLQGTPSPNGTLSVSLSNFQDADGIGTVSYHWYFNGQLIEDKLRNGSVSSTSGTLKLDDKLAANCINNGKAADLLGDQFSVKIVYTDLKGALETAVAAPVTVVAAPGSPDTVAPSASVVGALMANTGHAVVQSSEAGTAYLVKSTVSVSNLASITSAADNTWNSVAVGAAGSNTSLSAAGLIDGVYKVYAADAAGNLSAASSGSVTIDSTPPSFQSAATSSDGSKLVLSYSETINATTAAAGRFTVTVAGAARAVNGVAVAGSTVELTLASAVSSAQEVTVAYADPTAGNDPDAVQDAVGNDAPTLPSTNVSNTVIAPNSAATGTVGIVYGSSRGFGKSNAPLIGSVLAADANLADADGLGALSYQWKVGTQAVAGATNAVYEIQASDVGKSVQVVVTYTDRRGFSESVTSAGTALVANGAAGTTYDSASHRADLMAASSGNDSVYSYIGTDRIFAGSGNDLIQADQTLNASYQIVYGNSSDIIHAGAGNDTVYAGHANDLIFGDAGEDSIAANNGNDMVNVGAGNDRVSLADGKDLLFGGDGNDQGIGGEGNDVLFGGSGDDALSGGIEYAAINVADVAGNDLLLGQDGNDALYAGGGNDTLLGGAGNDFLTAGLGNDFLDGGTGWNILNGDRGNDTYVIRNRTDLIRDLGGTDSATVYADLYNTNPTIETWNFAPGVKQLPYWINALLDEGDSPATAALKGQAKTLKVYFPTATPATDPNWIPFTSAEKTAALAQLRGVEDLIDVKFVETNDAAGDFTIAFWNFQGLTGAAGVTYYDASDPNRVKIFFQNGNGLFTDPLFQDVFLHELGHALGLKHPFQDGEGPQDLLPTAEDNELQTIMSYTYRPPNGSAFEKLDIAALQYFYGPSLSARSGNDTYVISATDTNFIWDGGGLDTLDARTLSAALDLSLEQGVWSFVGSKSTLITAAGQVTINVGTDIENLWGGSGADRLSGNGLANQIDGGAGNDLIQGGAGNDSLIGGDGTDTVVYALARSQYSITLANGVYTVQARSGLEGTDTLTGFEVFRFADGDVDLSGIAGPGGNAQPMGAVRIEGDPVQGQVLTAVSELSDADGMGTLSYQWLADGVPIAGARQPSILLLQQDVGKQFSVQVSYTDGKNALQTATSDATLAVFNVNDLPTGLVQLSGTAKVGQTLTATVQALNDLDGIDLGQLSYQWFTRTLAGANDNTYNPGTPIAGATGLTFLITNSEYAPANQYGWGEITLALRVSYTDGSGTLETFWSDPSSKVIP